VAVLTSPGQRLIGIRDAGNSTTTGQALNSATTFSSFSFVPDENWYLTGVRIVHHANNGTMGAGEVTAELRPDKATQDGADMSGAALASVTGTLNSGTVGTVVLFSGFDYTLVAGTRYWIVFKNTNGTPGTNYPTIRYRASAQNHPYIDWWEHRATTDGGTTWGTAVYTSPIIQFIYTGGRSGTPLTNWDAFAASLYGKRAYGTRFVVPAGHQPVQITHVGNFQTRKTGSPTGDLRVDCYKNGVFVQSSSALLNAQIPTTSNTFFYHRFNPHISAVAGDVLDFVLRWTVDSNTSGNALWVALWFIDNDAGASSLLTDWQQQYVTTDDDSVSPPAPAATTRLHGMNLRLKDADYPLIGKGAILAPAGIAVARASGF
jgi:hypothetical protein